MNRDIEMNYVRVRQKHKKVKETFVLPLWDPNFCFTISVSHLSNCLL
jgi:hypothetical protein